MSRRDAGAAASHVARHARDRLRSTLGDGSRGLLLTDGSPEGFQYDDGSGHMGESAGRAKPEAEIRDSIRPPPPGTHRMGQALRWRLGLRVAVLLGIIAVLAGAWFWWQVSEGRPEVLPLDAISPGSVPAVPDGIPGEGPATEPPAGSGQLESGKGNPAAAIVVVHVAGAVARPGVVQLPSGSRVHEAIAAAGGGTISADLNRLNLAAAVTDGEKIYVPGPGEPLPADSSGASLGPAGTGDAAGDTAVQGAGGKTNLNTAGVQELDALPKVGPVLAQRIVDWRKEHGPFKTVEELDAVDGVGPKMLEALLPLVSV
ncbi:competence protein ComEA [Arthrobacter pascens]|uniref:ComEA family DNA-binding protein n=1 Tax=Arthrobacter pascens TaxID=1677 RepID=UPI00278D985D|nr:ComEA family DNA-binding protein [Arthrobacter pascens]MDQ0678271.1 competence protein ComEA [Arthrobacter pascens]